MSQGSKFSIVAVPSDSVPSAIQILKQKVNTFLKNQEHPQIPPLAAFTLSIMFLIGTEWG